MAAKAWNADVNVEGVVYHLEFRKNKLYINGLEQNLRKIESNMKFPNTEYYIPIGEKKFTLFVREFTEPILALDGRNYVTGEPYEFRGMPWWSWIFIILHASNFFTIIGGAIGGAACAGFGYLSAWIASNYKMNTVARIFSCIGIWIGAIVVELLVGIFVSILLSLIF